MAAADVDIGYVAGHLGLDEPVLTNLTSQPTAELVSTLLNAIAAKAHEFDTLYSEKLQTDIELENVVRSAESRSQSSKATVEKSLKDAEEARRKLQEEETKRQAVENELSILKTKQSDHEAELKTLSDQVETLQSSNRTNLSILESNNKRDQTLTEELTKQHQRNVELAREATTLQQSEQNAKGQLNSAKYREDSLKQQLELARRNVEWFENELKTKSDEGLKYRKEKGSRIAELQRESEDARSNVDALKRSEQQLRDRLDAMQGKADDALVRLQKQESNFTTTIDSYKQELEAQQRLVDMSDQLSKKHQDRVRDLEAEKERLRDNYENEVRRIRQELEQERQVTTEMETRIRQLEGELDELQARLEQAPPIASTPQTPRQNGSFLGRPGSPFATPGSIRSKSAITATQAIEQLYQVKGQLASEKRRSQQLSEELDNMMTALEAKAPEIQELQGESDTLREEIARMSELSQQSFEERDVARRAARKAEASLSTTQSEAKILRTQLRDLGTQIQMLVFNSYAIEKGADQLTDEEKYRIQQLEKGEITEEALAGMSDTHQFITQKLLVFKDIKSLQAKNEDLMRITRELAEQIESEEALAAKHQAKQDHDMVDKLQQDLGHMAEEAKSIKNTMESYKMERDMFRRLLQQRGTAGDEASMMRSSLDGRLPLASIEAGEQTEAINEALRKLQAEYDSFRDAQDGVRKDFREQIDRLSSEKGLLQTDKVKLSGEARLESERREMLQGNYTALQSENSELQKRSQHLSEAAAKQDIRTQQIAEELIEAKGLVDSMRNETANLKAEKKLWKDIQDRMSKDNETLIEEKNRINSLLATQQSLENERNLSESESRRKAQAKIESLEQELSGSQKKLSQEVEDGKKLQLRKEYESKEARKRIDDLMASLSQMREDHVGVKTTRDHLQARVDELTVELRSAEDRVGRLQPRPTPRPGTVNNNEQQQQLEAEIQDLNNEVADLKRDLDMANTQLENAKVQAEQYRELSQANEEALEDLRGSQDQYQQEMEALVEEKNSTVKELGQRVEDVSEELSRSNTELSALRDSQGEVARKAEDEKAILDEEVARLKEDSARHVEGARYHQQDLRAQAEIASKAQQDYETELVKHAEAARLVQQMRTEFNQLRSESASLRAEAESAKVTLTQSEGSWEDRRQQLEQEMAELKTRREDVSAQNKLLHQQLDGLTAQVVALQQNRNSGADDDEVMSPVDAGDVTDGLRELNNYLRREKEILEVQYDIKLSEAKRLQQQLEYSQSQLDEARLKLDQERNQSSQNNKSSMAHQDLMEKLNELNLYRESSMALRNENGQLKKQIAEKNTDVEAMEAKVQPLEAEIDSLNTQKGFLEDEIKQVQEDRDRWQKRTEGILTKYGRVDPAEMEQLQESIKTLETERDALREGEEPLRTKLNELEAVLESERNTWQTNRGKMVEQFKERSKRITGEKNDAIQRANTTQEQLDTANSQLQSVNGRIDESDRQRSDLESQVESFRRQVDELRQQAQQTPTQAPAQPAASQDNETLPDAPVQEPSTPAPATPAATAPIAASPAVQAGEAMVSAEVLMQLERQLVEVRKELEAVNTQKSTVEQQLVSLRSELQTVTAERDEMSKKLQANAAAQESNGAEAAKEPARPVQNGAPGLSDEEKKDLEDRIKAAETKAEEFEKKAQDLETNITQTVKERSDRMKDLLNNKLKQNRTKMEEEYQKKNADFDLRLEQEKRIWQAENAASKPANNAPPVAETPSTPSKVQPQQQQQTPAATNNPATPGTPGGQPDLSQLDDTQVRQFLSTNQTVKNVFSANLKKRLEVETVKLRTDMKAEYDAKITSARDQAQLMESKKSTLRVNMSENKLRAAQAKIGVVETAAKETPERPVGEVWAVAKVAQAPPSVAATAAAAAATPRPALGRQPTTPVTANMAGGPGTPTRAAAPLTGTAKTESIPQATPAQPAQTLEAPTAQTSTPASVPSNPFAVPNSTASTATPNPFAARQQPAAGAAATPAPTPQTPQVTKPMQQSQQQTQPVSSLPPNPNLPQPPQQGAAAQQAQRQQGARSGIPMVRGSMRGRGTYANTGQRNASGDQSAATGTVPPPSSIPGAPGNAATSGAPTTAATGGPSTRGARGGRGGSRGGGANFNPGVQDFQPGTGNKRPRGDAGDAAAAGGVKRPRGSH